MTKEFIAVIVKIMRYETKESEGVSLERAELTGDYGLLGDYYAGRSKRQVSLLSQKAREYIDTHKDEGLCFAKFKENLTYCGELPETPVEGALLSIGEAVLRVIDGKDCFSECTLFQRSGRCPLASYGKFAEVIKGGTIRLGNEIIIT